MVPEIVYKVCEFGLRRDTRPGAFRKAFFQIADSFENAFPVEKDSKAPIENTSGLRRENEFFEMLRAEDGKIHI